jgi:hypothetical protein
VLGGEVGGNFAMTFTSSLDFFGTSVASIAIFNATVAPHSLKDVFQEPVTDSGEPVAMGNQLLR